MPAFDQTQYPVGMDQDENGYPIPKVKITSNSMQPVDIQSHYAQTIQTHSGVTVAPSGYSRATNWVDCDGFDRLAVTFSNDAGSASYIDAIWSNDGSTEQGLETLTAPTSNQRKAMITDIKARYLKIALGNTDGAAAHVMSAWAYLKA